MRSGFCVLVTDSVISVKIRQNGAERANAVTVARMSIPNRVAIALTRTRALAYLHVEQRVRARAHAHYPDREIRADATASTPAQYCKTFPPRLPNRSPFLHPG